jgi:hypothetical protein
MSASALGGYGATRRDYAAIGTLARLPGIHQRLRTHLLQRRSQRGRDGNLSGWRATGDRVVAANRVAASVLSGFQSVAAVGQIAQASRRRSRCPPKE